MAGSRLKLGIILSGLVVGTLLAVGATQDWFRLELSDGGDLPVSGGTAVPAQTALALAGLAVFAVVGMAGPVLRTVLGVLGIAIGALVIWMALTAIADPIGASLPVIAAATGLVGRESLESLVQSTTQSPWPGLSVGFAAVFLVLAVSVIATSPRWPRSSRKYRPVGLVGEPVDDSAVDDWDALSGGTDPTSGNGVAR